jgi:hypothetical protein
MGEIESFGDEKRILVVDDEHYNITGLKVLMT